MSKEILFKRVMEGKCPISNTQITNNDKVKVVEYNEAKLKVKAKYVRFTE